MRNLLKANHPLSSLANHLVNSGLLSLERAKKIEHEASVNQHLLITYLVKNHIIASEIILESCAKKFGLPIFDLSLYEKSWLKTLNVELLKQYHFVPLKKRTKQFKYWVIRSNR